MHSLIGTLRCVDCEDVREFSSAASLLSHFAQHILDNENSGPMGTAVTLGTQCSPTSPSHKKRKSDSILEQVLQRTTLQHAALVKEKASQDGTTESAPVTVLIPVRIPPSLCKLKQSKMPQLETSEPSSECSVIQISPIENEPTDAGMSHSSSSSSSTSSSSSSSSGSVSSNGSTKCSRTVKLLNGSQVSLATFDMQQRLENCVLNLVSKRENSGTSHSGSRAVPPLIPTKSYFSEANDSWDTASVGDEINPLTLCTVTIGDEDDVTDMKSSDLNRKSSGRKQQTPKKITRADGMLSELSCKLPHNTTITSVCTLDKEKSHTKKKYPCHICSKVFGWSTDLKRHILIHTGERPFKCKLCPSSFTRNFLLQKHENKVHHRYSTAVNGHLNSVSFKLQSVQPNRVLPDPSSAEGETAHTEMSEDERCQEIDDRSSADENDNHSRKRKISDVDMSEQCKQEKSWHCSPISQQKAVQKIQ